MTEKVTGAGSAPTDDGRRGRPRDPEAEERIRSAAAQLLLERGLDATTIDAVAERAGVGKATVYRRFASKDELASAAFEALFEREVRVPDTGSLLGDLTAVYRDLLVLANQSEGRAFFRLAAAEAGRDPKIGELYRHNLTERLAQCAPVFDQAIERGELTPDADRQLMFDWPTGLLVLRVLLGSPLPEPSEAAALAQATVYGFTRRDATPPA